MNRNLFDFAPSAWLPTQDKAVLEYCRNIKREEMEFTNANVEEAAAIIGEYDIVPEAVAKQAVPHCSIVYIDGEEMQTLMSGYLQVLFNQNPKAVGGAVPADDFYFQR